MDEAKWEVHIRLASRWFMRTNLRPNMWPPISASYVEHSKASNVPVLNMSVWSYIWAERDGRGRWWRLRKALRPWVHNTDLNYLEKEVKS